MIGIIGAVLRGKPYDMRQCETRSQFYATFGVSDRPMERRPLSERRWLRFSDVDGVDIGGES